MIFSRKGRFVSVVGTLTLLVQLAAPVRAQKASAEEVTTRLEKTLKAPALKHATVSVLVRSLDTKKTVFERNADASLLPASNQKLVTSTAALGLLGPTFTYTTKVYVSGDDVILQGSGDPSLDTARLEKLAAEVAKSGLTTLKGRVLYDASCFDDERLGDGWQWDDEPFDYSAQVSGLCCDENVVSVTVAPGATVGAAATATASTDYATLESKVTTVAGSETDVHFDRVRGKNLLVLTGTIGEKAKPRTGSLTIEDPARFTAHRFVAALKKAGIALPDGASVEKAITPAALTPVATTESVPLAQLLKDFLKPSDNLYGECLLKTIGAVKGGAGTVAAGKKAVMAWLASRGIPTEGVAEADGSGLSRMNLITARLILGILTDRADDKIFRDALPIGGVDGTLKNRFKNTPAQGNVRAKTGTLTGASSLSGYLTTKAGERLAFSILMNNYERAGGAANARAAQDALVLALLDWPKK